MSRLTSPRLLRGLAALLIRGPHAPTILADLEELFRRDLERGLSRGRAGRRYAFNTLASAFSVLRARALLLVGGAAVSWLDVKLAVRMLGKQPMLTGVAMLALGLGIPASLTPIHTVNAMMAPLPFEDGERLFGIRHWDVETNAPLRELLHDFAVWREELTTFQAIAAHRFDEWNVHSDDGRAEPVRGVEISASAFEILRVPPIIGRTLTAPDEVIGAPDVVVIATALWESRFARDPEILGRAVRIEGVPHVVVGVMPEGFHYPRQHQLWRPLRANPTDFARGEGPRLQVFGRLADGVSKGQARAEVEMVRQRLAAEYPDTHERLRGEVVTMPIQAWGMRADGEAEPNIYVLQFAAILLLMIVCGNVGIMILARTATRAGEIAVRTALGASRLRIVSQLLFETLVLAVVATGFGLIVADWSAGRFETLVTGNPYMDMSIRWPTVALALGLAVLCAGVASLLPALKATGRNIQGNLQRAAGRASAIRFGAGSTALIVAEVALAVGGLSAGAAWTRTILQDPSDMGIELEHYLTAQLLIPSPEATTDQTDGYLDDFRDRARATQLEVKRRLESEPGVLSVAMTNDFPGSRHFQAQIEREEEVASGSTRVHQAAVARVDVDFFQDLGRPILDGRDFESGDVPEQQWVGENAAIVNTTLVEQAFGGQSPIGKRFRYLRGPEPRPWYEIVGVVERIGTNSLNPARDAAVYHVMASLNPMGFLIETGGDPAAFTPRLRAIAAEVDPTAMVRRTTPLTDLADVETAPFRYLALALVLSSVIAILLSTAGLFALMSFTVAQRTREIGVRTALGAHPWSIVSTIGRRAAIQLTLGVVLGAPVAAVVLANLSQNPLMMPQNMALVVGSVVAGTMLVGACACLIPTFRGLRIQPTEALREG